jgi:hypothetical protein
MVVYQGARKRKGIYKGLYTNGEKLSRTTIIGLTILLLIAIGVFPGFGLLVKSSALSALIMGYANRLIVLSNVAGHGASNSSHRYESPVGNSSMAVLSPMLSVRVFVEIILFATSNHYCYCYVTII